MAASAAETITKQALSTSYQRVQVHDVFSWCRRVHFLGYAFIFFFSACEYHFALQLKLSQIKCETCK